MSSHLLKNKSLCNRENIELSYMTIICIVVGCLFFSSTLLCDCGFTFNFNKKTSIDVTGIACGFTVQNYSYSNSVKRYKFYTNLSLFENINLNKTVGNCLLFAYDGPKYSVGYASLVSINDSINTNYLNSTSECFEYEQFSSCNSGFLIFCGAMSLMIGLIICCLTIIVYVDSFLNKEEKNYEMTQYEKEEIL